MFKKHGLLLLILTLLLAWPALTSASDGSLFVFRRGNGYGDVIASQGSNQVLSCGETCTVNLLDDDTKLTFKATARSGSVFRGWSVNKDNASSEPQISTADLSISPALGDTIVYAKFELEQIPENPVVSAEDKLVPRVMFWFGKVNQHWDLEKGVWATDPDGDAGARENKLEYCLKFYPDTIKVVAYKNEFTNTWKHAGNGGNYISTKPSYRCVQKGESVSGEDASNLAEKPNKGSVCYYFPDLPLCLPLSDSRAIRSPLSGKLDTFVSMGVDANSAKLGEGERAAVLKSYSAAFSELPKNEEEFNDVIKISNGQWPSRTSESAETKAREEFQKIYKRLPNMENKNDQAAITVMAYGLRQKAENRNLASEAAALRTFKNVYKHEPATTEEWNILQAITYSGAVREADTDGDLLSDRREKELGTDLNNKDTDGDGYFDGIEVANGFDPLKADKD